MSHDARYIDLVLHVLDSGGATRGQARGRDDLGVRNADPLQPGDMIHGIGDAHVYLNHVDGLRRQIERGHHPMSKSPDSTGAI